MGFEPDEARMGVEGVVLEGVVVRAVFEELPVPAKHLKVAYS